MPGLDLEKFWIDRCHCLDGHFKPTTVRRVLCVFNWHYDVQYILRNRKSLPTGIFVSEDLPEEWSDRRKVLRPIYNAAKQIEKLKTKTRLNKDRLIIDGHTFTAGPNNNVSEANKFVNVVSTCERSNDSTIVFLGSLSPFSNLYKTKFTIDNVSYNSAEQYIQSEKASVFGDYATQARIMQEENTYKIKNLEQKFEISQWKNGAQSEKRASHKAVFQKFSQN